MAVRNGRGITRDDLNDSINNLSTLVDAKLDRVLDKVENTHAMMKNHIAQEEVTTAQIRTDLLRDQVANKEEHAVIRKDVEVLTRYRWMLVGAIALIVFAAKYLGHALFGW